jgi:hypothetical protein
MHMNVNYRNLISSESRFLFFGKRLGRFLKESESGWKRETLSGARDCAGVFCQLEAEFCVGHGRPVALTV